MNLTREQLDMLHRLASSVIDGTIQADEFRELTALLTTSSGARKFYAQYMSLQATLVRAIARAEAPAASPSLPVPLSPSPPVSPSPALSTVEGSRRRFALSSLAWSILAASLLFAAYFIGISWDMLRSRHSPSAVAEVSDDDNIDRFSAAGTRSVPSTDTVATIRESSEVEWSQDSEFTPFNPRPRPGAKWSNPEAEIHSGQPLSIRSGLIELQLKQGTTLVIEGPADWKITGENSATLTHGKLVAKVPQQAIGFTLETPTAKIIDLGTEFGVEVGKRGTANVHVSKGLVDVQSANGSTKPGPGKLQAGQSVQISPAGEAKVENSHSVPEKFKRLFAASESKETKSGDARPGAAAGSIVVTFQQGKQNPLVGGEYTGCSDAQLISWAPNENHGKRGNFDVSSLTRPANSLLRFDLTPLAGKFSKITKARLLLNQDQLLSVRAPGVVKVHLLAVLNRDWVEGTGVSSQTRARDGATWNQRRPGERWAGAAGASKAGIDYDERLLAHHDYEAKYVNRPFVFEIEGDLKFLADWANDDATNAGFLLRSGEEKTANTLISFYSSDFPDAVARPALEVEYEPSELESKRLTVSRPQERKQ